MNNPRFVILTGHLTDYPLSDLVGILRHQRKTGRLLIEFEKGPAVLFFHEGELVDAKVNDLTGLQAVCFALGQPPASFNFNPLIQPSQRTIEKSLQRTVSELFGCWDDTGVQIEAGSVEVPLLEEPSSDVSAPALSTHHVERLALPAAPISRPMSMLVMVAAALTTIGVSIVISLSGSFRSGTGVVTASAAAERSKLGAAGERGANNQGALLPRSALEGAFKTRSQSNRNNARKNERSSDSGSASSNADHERQDSSKTLKANSQAQAVTVVMEIEEGRVLRASIANPKPGMDSYEALALRIARQRRYPAEQNGRETVKIKVSPSEQ